MATSTIEDALGALRDAEQLLDALPPVSPDHETVRLLVVTLRSTYEAIAARRSESDAALVSARETIANARQTLEEIRGRAPARLRPAGQKADQALPILLEAWREADRATERAKAAAEIARRAALMRRSPQRSARAT
jgi:hypothetical protein